MSGTYTQLNVCSLLYLHVLLVFIKFLWSVTRDFWKAHMMRDTILYLAILPVSVFSVQYILCCVCMFTEGLMLTTPQYPLSGEVRLSQHLLSGC